MRSLPNEAPQQTANSATTQTDASYLRRKYRGTFLSINGISVEYEDADLIKTVLSVADGTCDEQQFLAWLRQHVSAEKG